jgi:hypothetical protein
VTAELLKAAFASGSDESVCSLGALGGFRRGVLRVLSLGAPRHLVPGCYSLLPRVCVVRNMLLCAWISTLLVPSAPRYYALATSNISDDPGWAPV